MSTVTVEFDVDTVDDLALDFIERQMFHEYDTYYKELTVDGLPRQEEVHAFQDGLEAITHIRAKISEASEAKLDNSVAACERAL